jgi:hypothetical protein
MFYGIIQEDYLYEFNFSEALDKLKQRIKNAILSLIDKIEFVLNKGKDNKIKQLLRSLLGKVKGLLTKADKIQNKDDAEKTADELIKCKDEFKNLNDVEYRNFKEIITKKDSRNARIMITDALLVNYPDFASTDSMYKIYKATFPDHIGDAGMKWFERKKKQLIEEKSDPETAFPSMSVAFVGYKQINDVIYNDLKQRVIEYVEYRRKNKK